MRSMGISWNEIAEKVDSSIWCWSMTEMAALATTIKFYGVALESPWPLEENGLRSFVTSFLTSMALHRTLLMPFQSAITTLKTNGQWPFSDMRPLSGRC
jgi:hypothetical protein